MSSFRFRQLDIPYLAQVLRLPEKFICPNRTAALTEEALSILFRRIAYPCRYVDMMPQFGRSPQELSLIANKVMDEIYETHGHLLATIDHPWLTRAKLREMADAVHEVGAALPNCWGFVDGTVNIRKKCFYTASRSCNPPFLTPPHRKNYYLLVSTFISVIGNLTAGDIVYTPGSPFLHPYLEWC